MKWEWTCITFRKNQFAIHFPLAYHVSAEVPEIGVFLRDMFAWWEQLEVKLHIPPPWKNLDLCYCLLPHHKTAILTNVNYCKSNRESYKCWSSWQLWVELVTETIHWQFQSIFTSDFTCFSNCDHFRKVIVRFQTSFFKNLWKCKITSSLSRGNNEQWNTFLCVCGGAVNKDKPQTGKVVLNSEFIGVSKNN